MLTPSPECKIAREEEAKKAGVKIKEWGFLLTFKDKHTGRDVQVFVDEDKVEAPTGGPVVPDPCRTGVTFTPAGR